MSDLGKMHKQNQNAAKRGEDIKTMLVEMDAGITQLTGLRDVLKGFLIEEIWDTQKLLRYINNMAGTGNHSLQQSQNTPSDLSPEELDMLLDMLSNMGDKPSSRKRKKR